MICLTAVVVTRFGRRVDLVLLDWLFVERLAPGRIAFPNAPGMRFTRGDAYHFRGFLFGTGLSLAAAVIIGGVAALVW